MIMPIWRNTRYYNYSCFLAYLSECTIFYLIGFIRYDLADSQKRLFCVHLIPMNASLQVYCLLIVFWRKFVMVQCIPGICLRLVFVFRDIPRICCHQFVIFSNQFCITPRFANRSRLRWSFPEIACKTYFAV